jgi:glutathione synthase/RimK-type ligase-like ATP-grasp enzyme
MTSWAVVANRKRAAEAIAPGLKVVPAETYVLDPASVAGRHMKIINLCNDYRYQADGYYVSLLAEARGHRVIPTVETILALRNRDSYAHALPELEQALNKALARSDAEVPERFLIAFGRPDDRRLRRFGQLLFDWFRAPLLRVSLGRGEWHTIRRIEIVGFSRLDEWQIIHAEAALAGFTAHSWRQPRPRPVAKYAIAVLYDPKEVLPPSSPESLQYWARRAARHDIEVEPITRRDLTRLAEFDALFIRETTSIRNHTYRFAQRAVQEGMPVIDDPISMIRCTNKIYLWQRLTAAGIPVPRTMVVSADTAPEDIAEAFGFPVVVKIPDGSFSRGVRKADTMGQLVEILTSLLEEADLLIAQEFIRTQFDWRIGVLDNQPLFACHYTMARKHWQIVRHREDGTPVEGGARAVALDAVPEAVLSAGVRAARLIGDGFYGVDIKARDGAVYVIEVNDNPNLDHGYEDAEGGREIWDRLCQWFVKRLA